MPAWAPGSYRIRDFGRHVHDVAAVATDGSGALSVERQDKQTWTVEADGHPFALSYRVYADALSVRSSFVDDRVALLNGSSVFVYVVDQKQRPATLTIDATPAGWETYTAMDPAGAPGRYRAASYDELADSPLLLGEAEVRSFEVGGAKLRYVLAAPSGTNADVDRLAHDAEKVVRAFSDIMGGLPFPNYDFLVVADPRGGGGLEHLRSTAMMVRSFAFTGDEAYTRAAHLAAHEFFHLWNVKRIHDRPLGPFDYTRETYTELLWFHEGFTETMEARALLRAGLVTRDEYLAQLGESYTRYRNRPGSHVESIASLSRDAWIKLYQDSSNDRNRTVSYYLKGDLIGVLLDLELRKRSGGRGSVEGMFASMWASRPSGATERVIDRQSIVDAATEQAGEDMSAFFDRFVWGTEILPLPDRLGELGIDVSARAPWESAEPSPEGPPGRDAEPDERARAWVGLAGDERLSWVPRGSPAERSGLMVGDELLAIDGARVRSVDEARARVADAGVGARVRVTFARRGRVDRRILTVAETPQRTWEFRIPDAPNPQTPAEGADVGLRDAWLPPATGTSTTATKSSSGSSD
jgi:predicted metalloprotease with PDZ domain